MTAIALNIGKRSEISDGLEAGGSDQTLPIAHSRWKDMAPHHVWRRIKARAMQIARLAGLTKAEWERRRIEYGSTRGADYVMLSLPTYSGALCEIEGARSSGHVLDGLTWLAGERRRVA